MIWIDAVVTEKHDSLIMNFTGLWHHEGSFGAKSFKFFVGSHFGRKSIKMYFLNVFELGNGAQHSPPGFQKSPYRELDATTQSWFSEKI